MKMRKSVKRFVLLVGVLLLLGVISSAVAMGAEKITECYSPDLDELGSGWIYLYDGLPESIYFSSGAIQINPKDGGDYELATEASATFVSGDQALKDIVKIHKEQANNWSGGSMKEQMYCYLGTDLSDVSEPGEAIYHFVCESESYIMEQDVTIRVLSWKEHPLFELSEHSEVIYPMNVELTATQMVEQMYRLNTDKISRELQLEHAAVLSMRRFFFYEDERDEAIQVSYYGTQSDGSGKKRMNFTPEAEIISWDDETYTFLKTGEYDMEYGFSFGNVSFRDKVRMIVVPYRIEGIVTTLCPGVSVQLHVQDEEPESGRTFQIIAEGEGLTYDDTTGRVTVSEAAEPGIRYSVTAMPSDGNYALTMSGHVTDFGALDGISFDIEQLWEGFTVPLLDLEGQERVDQQYSNARAVDICSQKMSYMLHQYVAVVQGDEFLENPDLAAQVLDDIESSNESLYQLEKAIIEIDGHPGLICTASLIDYNGFAYYTGELYIFRNQCWLQIQIDSFRGEGGVGSGLPRITLNDMKQIAEKITYDPSLASIIAADAEITLSTKDDVKVVSGGKKLQFVATFANPERVNKKAKNDQVEWSVVDVNTQTLPENVTIDKNGNLAVNQKLADVLTLQVKATSSIFHTQAVYEVTAIPAVKKLTVEPSQLFFYTGTDQTQTVKVAMDPENVPPMGIVWTADKKDIVEIIAGEDGTAEIKSLKAGKVNLTAKEPSGKSGKVMISVVEPVAALNLSVKGKPQAGKTVNISAELEPKNAGNKELEWSINADETVATISAKGQLKIDKSVEPGTEIVVTCKALGAPDPIEQTIAVTVE